MKTIDVSEASEPLAEYAKEPVNDAVIVTIHGGPVIAVLSLKNADWETISLSLNPRLKQLIDESRRGRIEGTDPGLSSEEVRQRFGLPKRGSG